MLQQQEYVRQKLHELELEALARKAVVETPGRRSRPVVGPLVLAAGGVLRRLGERMEGWAAPGAGLAPRVRP